MKRSLFILLILIAGCKKEEVQPSEDAITTIANAETVKPTVSFTFPHNQDVVQNTVLIQVSATDASGIKNVVLKIDGIKKATDKTAPYEFVWDTKQFVNNFHKLTAKATDIFGNAKTVNITVLVQNEILPPQPNEQELIDLINAERNVRNLNSLVLNDKLLQICREHSQDMAINNFFSHTSFDGRTFAQRMTDVGYPWTSASENLSITLPTAQEVFDQWMANSGQKANMLNSSFKDIGIGYFKDTDPDDNWTHYWTGVFATTQ